MGISVDDSEAFCSFIANETRLSEELAKMRVIDGLVRFFGGEFEGIKKFILRGVTFG